jgi:glycosyltransferase involved in cell wall biosynthesis
MTATTTTTTSPPPSAVDVCLVLEGSYPRVTGGVCSWAAGLMAALPDVRFAVANVSHEGSPLGAAQPDPAPPNLAAMVELTRDPQREQSGAELGAALPAAAIYHACLTGDASDAAAEAVRARGGSMLLTEHGLAWREAGWTSGCHHHHRLAALAERERRVRRAAGQARAAYRSATAVTSVCSVNVAAQRRWGAAAERSLLIPNCPARHAGAGPEPAPPGRPLRIGFVGRIVAIKDVITFLRAAALIEASLAAEFVLVGPLHHDPAYAERCRAVARSLGLERRVRFIGEADPSGWYERLDVVVLTSLSEAQPLVLLEAMAAGLPCVATAVGGCPELLAARPAGASAGPAGLLVAPGDHRAVARALVRLAVDPELRARLGASGRERVLREHAPELVWAAYRRLYERLAG